MLETETPDTATPKAAHRNEESPQASQRDDETYRLHRRFDRFGRLVGDSRMKKLMSSHVVVIGLGGVGSWAAEAVVRSGVGRLTIVDFDEICVTNANRQLHALTGLIGQNKAEVLAERFRKINPQCRVEAKVKFYNAETSDEILGKAGGERPDFVVDAIDNITAKCHLLARCRAEGIPVVCSTGSAGRFDPTRISIADLSETEIDPLAKNVRRILRQKHGFPEKGSFGIPAVFSHEPVSEPLELHYDGGNGFSCVCPNDNDLHSCDDRNVILGSASFVTGSFGFACASVAMRGILGTA